VRRMMITVLTVTCFWSLTPAWAQEEGSIARRYAAALSELGEPDLAVGADTAETYRALWLRSFHERVAVRVYRRDQAYTVVTVQGTRRDSTSLDPSLWDAFHFRDALKKFWSTVADEPGGLDGARWILEGRHAGRYHAVDWWSPQGDEGIEGGYRRLFLEILSLGSVCVSPDAVY